jgi:hypothetical protein
MRQSLLGITIGCSTKTSTTSHTYTLAARVKQFLLIDCPMCLTGKVPL